MAETGGDELEAVKKYFNTAGFERWNKIYGETDEVNKVRLGSSSSGGWQQCGAADGGCSGLQQQRWEAVLLAGRNRECGAAMRRGMVHMEHPAAQDAVVQSCARCSE